MTMLTNWYKINGGGGAPARVTRRGTPRALPPAHRGEFTQHHIIGAGRAIQRTGGGNSEALQTSLQRPGPSPPSRSATRCTRSTPSPPPLPPTHSASRAAVARSGISWLRVGAVVVIIGSAQVAVVLAGIVLMPRIVTKFLPGNYTVTVGGGGVFGTPGSSAKKGL